MKYFQNPQTKEVAGFDETVPSQLSYMQIKIAAGWADITDSWPPFPTKEQNDTKLLGAVSIALTKGAEKWGYDSIESGASYVNSTNPQYKADAEALIGWRDSVWGWALQAIKTAPANETPEQFLQSMPVQPAQPTV